MQNVPQRQTKALLGARMAWKDIQAIKREALRRSGIEGRRVTIGDIIGEGFALYQQERKRKTDAA